MDPLLQKIAGKLFPVTTQNRDAAILLNGNTAAELAAQAAVECDGVHYRHGIDLTKPMTIFGCPVVFDDRIPPGEFRLVDRFHTR